MKRRRDEKKLKVKLSEDDEDQTIQKFSHPLK
jgi:hypothetical protein